jgi:hypothetical protein
LAPFILRDPPIEKVLEVLKVLDEKVQKSNIEEKIKKVGFLDCLSATANVSIVTQVPFINL